MTSSKKLMIDLVVGCRPNFVKAAAILEAAKKFPEVDIRLIHTGQHSEGMSDPFFKEFGMPEPTYLITYETTRKFGPMLRNLQIWWESSRPDMVMVVGDTDSTCAAAIAAGKAFLPLIHVEAGLRIGNKNMQEEVNRLLIDSVSTLCYTTTQGASDNLLREGKPAWAVQLVGNVMIDTLLRYLPKANEKYGHRPFAEEYAVLTLHRAENVDDLEKYNRIMGAVSIISRRMPVFFPVHPRLQSHGIPMDEKIVPMAPQSYLEFVSLIDNASFVMTDSGGVQEEATGLGVPCFTLRENTERPETVHQGSNEIIGTDPQNIVNAIDRHFAYPTDLIYPVPPLWDGQAADRLMEDLVGRML